MTHHCTLRVTSIRSQNPTGFGGCIFSGKSVGSDGAVQDALGYFVVKVPYSVLGAVQVQVGQWWNVAGPLEQREIEINGYRLSESQIQATSAYLLRPSGEHLVAFIADSPAFEGIGQVKARRLWDAFGNELYAVLDRGDVGALSKVLTEQIARQLVSAWAEHGDSRTLQWLHANGFDVALGKKVLQFFGGETQVKLEEDPYRLLSFCASWRQVDTFARSRFAIAIDDPRRLRGAVEEACYRVFAAGHTVVMTSRLMNVLQGVLGGQTQGNRWRKLVLDSLSQGLSNGSYVVGLHGLQPLGALALEREVALSVADRMHESRQQLLRSDEVGVLISDYEMSEGITLNDKQREAVLLSTMEPFLLMTGGAGVGKTTVLKAMYHVFDKIGLGITQLALAGRAAKRMQEATGRPSSTIASFLRAERHGGLDENNVVVVDEASMIDIVSMARLCEILGSAPRLILVGDSAQLMPVGPGLVLHSLSKVPEVPLVELTVVKRYGGAIAAAATAIRAGRWPRIDSDPSAPIFFVERSSGAKDIEMDSIPATVLQHYMQDPQSTQILCARRNGLDGSRTLNLVCQSKMTGNALPILVWSAQHQAMADTGFRLGDKVLCTRNLWDRGLQNGSLGTIVEAVESLASSETEDCPSSERVLAQVEWDDGVVRPLVEAMLDDLELGYAITVHKAQGSQWPRVIVPVTPHRLLDRTLLYTAVTRAQTQVILIGEQDAAKHAVVSAPRVESRQVALDLTLVARLAEVSA